jgi:ubiquitin carboxyl-terminal hydrolase 2/21
MIQNDFSIIQDSKHKSILLAYQDLIKTLWSTYKPAYVKSSGFLSEIRKAVSGTIYDMFSHPIPNDSHEFLIFLLDNFHEALKKDLSGKKGCIPENANMSEKAEHAWNTFLNSSYSDIILLFFGMIRKTIQCLKCNNHVYNWELFNCLKIQCTESSNFIDWLKEEFKESAIDEYFCEKCKEKQNAKIISEIWKLPKNLFITIQRFHFDGTKNTTQCPEPYTENTLLDMSNFFCKDSNDISKKWKYELTAISDHHGSHIGGHYTTQFKSPISKEWWWFDDEKVISMKSPRFGSNNYIFLFKAT